MKFYFNIGRAVSKGKKIENVESERPWKRRLKMLKLSDLGPRSMNDLDQ